MKVAIITSVYYPDDSLTKFDLVKKVLSIIPDYAGVDYDLFIMNDGVEDPRFHKFIKEYTPRGHYKNIKYTHRENKGITKSLNELLSQVDDTYDYICLLDLDVFVPVYWLKKCISVLNHNMEPGALGPARPLQNNGIGICGVLVQDKLSFNLESNICQTKEQVLFSLVDSIGGACLVFRAKELKSYGWDETLISDHIDAYIISRYRVDGKTTFAILDRGYHPREIYESEKFRDRKLVSFQKELPKFYTILNNLNNNK
jgi:cellulose synthase/poly-beta-1,6-N-acetylglucosamine synthase-like glycosyltransferase